MPSEKRFLSYADDFVCVVRYTDDAERIERAFYNRFNKYGLELHADKSRRFSFGPYERENAQKQKRRANTFDFLGVTHYCAVSRKGRFKVGRKTSRKKFAAKCKDLTTWLKKIRNMVPTKDWWQTLRSKLRGHFQYYGVSENYGGISRFYKFAIRAARKWINRRSQKGRMSWERFMSYLEHYPLPTPRICHSFYESRVALQRASSKRFGVEVAWSNPCFEVWYLLHFQYRTTPVERSELYRKLSKVLGFAYEKSAGNIYELLKDQTNTATRNATRLLAEAKDRGLPPAETNPGTTVHNLVTLLLDLQKS